MSSLLSNERPIAVLPQTIRIGIVLGVSMFFFLLAIVSVIFWMVQTVHFFPVPRLPFLNLETAIEIGLLAGPVTLWCYASLRFWLLIERRRCAVVAGDRRWLLVAQPNLWQSASPVPQAIILRFNRISIWFLVLTILAYSLTTLAYSLSPIRNGLALYDVVGVSFFLLLIIGPIVLVFICFVVTIRHNLLVRHTVEATETNLEARWEMEGGKKLRRTSVPWQEARFFACYKLPKFMGYELVGQLAIAYPLVASA